MAGVFGSIGSAIGSFFGFGGKPAKTPTTQASGSDGEMAPGGFPVSFEKNPDLVGTNLQKTLINTLHQTTIVASAVRAYLGLCGSASWHAEANEAGGKNGQKGADLVEFGLIDATMPNPWQQCVEKQSYFHLGGFAIHEWTIRRRKDGRVVFAELGHRPQSTIWRWQKDDERKPLQGVEQLTIWGNRWYMPRERIWYTVDNTLTDSPQGMGILRHVVDPAHRLQLLTRWEAFAYEKDLRGIPVGLAPLEELAAKAKTEGLSGQKANDFIAGYTNPLTNLLENHLKGQQNNTALLLSSATYTTKDQAQTPSAVPKWALKLLQGDSGPLDQLNKSIQRITWEIATLLQAEWLLIGMSNGTYNLHDNKTALMAQAINRTLTRVGDTATADLARPLVSMNGLDPEVCTPKLRADPIASDAVDQVTKSLMQLAMAGAPLQPDDPAIDQIRRRLYLDAQPKVAPDLGLPRAPARLPRESMAQEVPGDTDQSPGSLPTEPRFLGKPPVGQAPEQPARAGKEKT